MTKVLFVCLGNICRSPAAEGVLRQRCPDVQIDSAGTSDWHVGDAPYGPMLQAAQGRGYDLSPLRARQFRAADFDEFDEILVMDSDNLRNVEAMRPAANTTRVSVFTDYGPQQADHVPDPYYTRDFDGCLDLIELCATGWAAQNLHSTGQNSEI